MKVSPIQLIESTLEKIAVEPNRGYEGSKESGLDHVTLQTFKRIIPAKEYWEERKPPIEGVEARTYLVTLGVRTSNDESLKGPYIFEVICSGIVFCVPEHIGPLSSERAAREYGLSLMYGQVREHVAALTSRMSRGIHMLPTVSFMGDGEPKPARAKSGSLEGVGSTSAQDEVTKSTAASKVRAPRRRVKPNAVKESP